MAMANKIFSNFTVAWDRLIQTKQTLFPVFGDKEDKKPRKGVPEVGEEGWSLRATKGVNMHPFPCITLTKMDGSKYETEEEIKISVVSAVDKMLPEVGSCSCASNRPLLTESKQFQLLSKEGEIYCKIRGGLLEFTKLQIGCCTGARGHGSAFCIKAEFIGEGSILRGSVIFSPAIEVGAKGPFAKIFSGSTGNGVALTTIIPSNQLIERPVSTGPSMESYLSKCTYEGAETMVALLHNLNLSSYISLFLENEIDLSAFLQLTEHDLTQLGITKVGPRVKILKEIARVKESPTLLPPQPQPQSSNPVAWASSLDTLFIPDATSLLLGESGSSFYPSLTWSSGPTLSNSSQQLPMSSLQQQQQQQHAQKKRKVVQGMTVPSSPGEALPSTPSLSLDLNNPSTPLSTFQTLPSPQPSYLSQPIPYRAPSTPLPSITNSTTSTASAPSPHVIPGGLCIYIFLSNIVVTANTSPSSGSSASGTSGSASSASKSNHCLRKSLFMVKSKRSKAATEEIVQQIHQEAIKRLKSQGKQVIHEWNAQLMLILQPDKHGDWFARSVVSDHTWSFKKGDYIKIDNHHGVDISIVVHHYLIPPEDDSANSIKFIEDIRSPKKYPLLFPGGSLEIGIDQNKDGRLALTTMSENGGSIDSSNIFAVTHNGKLLPSLLPNQDSCVFSFKRTRPHTGVPSATTTTVTTTTTTSTAASSAPSTNPSLHIPSPAKEGLASIGSTSSSQGMMSSASTSKKPGDDELQKDLFISKCLDPSFVN